MENITPQDEQATWMECVDDEQTSTIRDQLQTLLRRFQKRLNELRVHENDLTAKLLMAQSGRGGGGGGGANGGASQTPQPSSTSWSWWAASSNDNNNNHNNNRENRALTMWDMVNFFSSYVKGSASTTGKGRRPWTAPMVRMVSGTDESVEGTAPVAALNEPSHDAESSGEDYEKSLNAAEETLRARIHEIMMRPDCSKDKMAEDSELSTKDMELLCEIQALARESSLRRERVGVMRQRLQQLETVPPHSAPVESAAAASSYRACFRNESKEVDLLIKDLKQVPNTVSSGSRNTSVRPTESEGHEKTSPGDSGDAEIFTLAVLNSTRKELERLRGHLEYVCGHYEDARAEARTLRTELEHVKSSLKCMREGSREGSVAKKCSVAISANIDDSSRHGSLPRDSFEAKSSADGGDSSARSITTSAHKKSKNDGTKASKHKRARDGKKCSSGDGRGKHQQHRKRSSGSEAMTSQSSSEGSAPPGAAASAAAAAAAAAVPSAALAAQLASFLEERSAPRELLERALATALRDVPAGSPATEAKSRLMEALALLAKTARNDEEACALARLLVRVALTEPGRVPTSPSVSATASVVVPPSEPVVADSADVAAAVVLETFLGVPLRDDLRARAFLHLLDNLPPNFTTTMVRDASVKALRDMAADEEDAHAATELLRAAAEVQEKDPARIGGAISQASSERLRREAQAVLLTVHRGRSLIEKFGKEEVRPAAAATPPLATVASAVQDEKLSREIVQVAYLLRGVAMRDEMLHAIFSEVMKQPATPGRSMAEAKEHTLEVVARLASWQSDLALVDEVAAVLVDVALKEPSTVERLMEQDKSKELVQQTAAAVKASAARTGADRSDGKLRPTLPAPRRAQSEMERFVEDIDSDYWPIGFVAIAGSDPSDPPVIPYFRQGNVPSRDVVCWTQEASKAADYGSEEESQSETATETQTESDGESYMSAEEEEMLEDGYESNLQDDISRIANVKTDPPMSDLLIKHSEISSKLMHQVAKAFPRRNEESKTSTLEHFGSDESCSGLRSPLKNTLFGKPTAFDVKCQSKITQILGLRGVTYHKPLDDSQGFSGAYDGGGGGAGGSIIPETRAQAYPTPGGLGEQSGGAPTEKNHCQDVRCQKKRLKKPEEPPEDKCLCVPPDSVTMTRLPGSFQEPTNPCIVTQQSGNTPHLCKLDTCPVVAATRQASQQPPVEKQPSNVPITISAPPEVCPAKSSNRKDVCVPSNCPESGKRQPSQHSAEPPVQASQQGPTIPECPVGQPGFPECFPQSCPVMMVFVPQTQESQKLEPEVSEQPPSIQASTHSIPPPSSQQQSEYVVCPAGDPNFTEICKPETCPVRIENQKSAELKKCSPAKCTEIPDTVCGHQKCINKLQAPQMTECSPNICKTQSGMVCGKDTCQRKAQGDVAISPPSPKPSPQLVCGRDTCPMKGTQTEPEKETRSTQAPNLDPQPVEQQTSLATQAPSEHQTTINYEPVECPASRADFQDICAPETCPVMKMSEVPIKIPEEPSCMQPGGDMRTTISTAPTCAPPQASVAEMPSHAATQTGAPTCNTKTCFEGETIPASNVPSAAPSAQPPAVKSSQAQTAPVGKQPMECDICSEPGSAQFAKGSGPSFTPFQALKQKTSEVPCQPETCRDNVSAPTQAEDKIITEPGGPSVSIQVPSTHEVGAQICSPDVCDAVDGECQLPECEISPSQALSERGGGEGTTAPPSAVPSDAKGPKKEPVGKQPMECDLCSNIESEVLFTPTPQIAPSPSTKPSHMGGGELPATISTAPPTVRIQGDASTYSRGDAGPCGPNVCPALQGNIMSSTITTPAEPVATFVEMQSCATQTCPFKKETIGEQGSAGPPEIAVLSAGDKPVSKEPSAVPSPTKQPSVVPATPSKQPSQQPADKATCTCRPSKLPSPQPPIEAPAQFRDNVSEKEIRNQNYGPNQQSQGIAFDIPGLCGDSRCKGVILAQEYFASICADAGPSSIMKQGQSNQSKAGSSRAQQDNECRGICQHGDCPCTEGCPREWLRLVEPMQQRADDVTRLLRDLEHKQRIVSQLQLLKDQGLVQIDKAVAQGVVGISSKKYEPSQTEVIHTMPDLQVGVRGHYTGYDHSNIYADSAICLDNCDDTSRRERTRPDSPPCGMEGLLNASPTTEPSKAPSTTPGMEVPMARSPSREPVSGTPGAQDACLIQKGEPCKWPDKCAAPCPPRSQVPPLKSPSAPVSMPSKRSPQPPQPPSSAAAGTTTPSKVIRCAKCKIRLAAGADPFVDATLEGLWSQKPAVLGSLKELRAEVSVRGRDEVAKVPLFKGNSDSV